MNTVHNGTQLGQALYKVCNRLEVVHKVSICLSAVVYVSTD